MSLYPRPLTRHTVGGTIPDFYRQHDNDWRTVAQIMAATGLSQVAVHQRLSKFRALDLLESRATYPKSHRFTEALWQQAERRTAHFRQPRAERGLPCRDLHPQEHRIVAALRSGNRFVRHYTYEDLAASLGVENKPALGMAIHQLKTAGWIVAERWGQHVVTLCLAQGEVDEASALFVSQFARPGHLYNQTHNINALNAWPTVSDCERELGLRNSALYRWLINHDLLVVCPKRGKYRRVPQQVFGYYLERTDRPGMPRGDKRPAGYVSVYAAADILASSVQLACKAAKRGQVAAVRVGVAVYYCKTDLEKLAWEMKDTPLPGYEAIRDRCEVVGADRATVTSWLQRKGREIRKFRGPDKQLTNYALKADLDEWQSRYTGDRRRFSMAQARDIRRRSAAGESNPALALEFGIDTNSIRQIVLGNTYREPELEVAA